MNNTLTSIMAALLVFLSGPVLAEAAGQETAEPQQPGATAEQKPAAAAESETAPAPEKAPEPITGAFGITLGEPFELSTVARVIGQQEQGYRTADGQEHTGTLYQVEPVQPDERFQRYALQTTDKGRVYAIRAEYQFDLEQEKADKDKKRATNFRKTCKNAVKSLAKEMEERHGRPRGRDMSGEWYAFRQFSETEDRSLRLYANRCRSGIYSVVYTDQALLGIQAKPKKQEQAQQPEAGEAQKQEEGADQPENEPGQQP